MAFWRKHTDEQSRYDQKDEAILQEIRDKFSYYSDQWRPIQEERRVDTRYVCGDPWEAVDRQARDKAGRPCISHDELNQYINQSVNNLRQNPRGMKFEPAGEGADDKTAELRQDLARRIENASHAPTIYSAVFQNMVEGSYGFARVGRRYVKGSFNQEITLSAFQNPDSVLPDPDSKVPDFSDQKGCFVLDPMPRKEFKRRWKKAKIQDFTQEDMRIAKDWIKSDHVLVCEYWRVDTEEVTLYELEDGTAVYELPEGAEATRTRIEEKNSVVQYITNGVEILEKNEQPGEIIPIIPCVGLQRWVDEGSGAKRMIFSLVRLAREPQMTLAFLCSQEAEEAGLTPKTPYVGYTGQFETDQAAWESATKIPHSYLQADPIVDGATGSVLPLPRREQFTPNFQAYEVAKDSARRAIQAAMGISPLPTAAQRNNEKSGVALERIESSQEVGSFHFMDAFDHFLEYIGRVVNQWIPVVYDTERSVALRSADESHRVVRINTREPVLNPKTQQLEQYIIDEKHEHDVTISNGPSAKSQREAADQFLDLLVQNLGTLPIPPPQQAKLLSLAIRMKQLGPKGDQMADIISPNDQEQLPPAAQAKLDQAHAVIHQLTQTLNVLTQKIQAKLPELATRERIALIAAKAGILEAALKAKSQEAMLVFEKDIEQIDRKLALMPDPGMEATSDGEQPQQPATQGTGSAPSSPQPQPLPQAA